MTRVYILIRWTGGDWVSPERLPVGALSLVAFSSSTNGVIFGEALLTGKSSYLYTSDGGQNWSDVKQLADGSFSTFSVAFTSSTNGMVVGTNASGNTGLCSYTTDAGQTWSDVKTFSDGTLVPSLITFSSATNGVVVGTNANNTQGLYSYTTDGGLTWSTPAVINGLKVIIAAAF
ncbi:MAG: hypothetical protein QM528_07920 [Phycisphaerales bacterium]|nr:hypothetical protein [Phycisphaerales bacterium]